MKTRPVARDALLNTIRGREEAIHVILGWVKTDVEIAVARGDLVPIGNLEHVVLRHEMVIPGVKNDRKPVRPLSDAGARNALAIATYFAALTAGTRIRPATTGGVGITI